MSYLFSEFISTFKCFQNKVLFISVLMFAILICVSDYYYGYNDELMYCIGCVILCVLLFILVLLV